MRTTNKAINKNLNIRVLPHADNQLRAVQNDNGTTTVSGYAIVFNKPSQPLPVDGQPTTFIEYIEPDALRDVDFSQTLLLYGHDYNQILARADSGTLKTSIDSTGLKFTATMPDTTLANDTRENIKSGNVRGCSFGFQIADNGDRWVDNDDGTLTHYVDQIKTVDELTITPIPAYPQTSVDVQRDLKHYLEQKGEKRMNNNSNTSSAVVSSATSQAAAVSANSSATSSATSSAVIDSETLANIVSRAVSSAVSEAIAPSSDSNSATSSASNNAQRDDDDDVNDDTDTDNGDAGDTDADDDDEEDDANNSATPASSATSQTSNVATSADSANSSASSATRSIKKEEHVRMMNITPNNAGKELDRSFIHYLKTHEINRDLRDASGNVGLNYGNVLIPKTFLPADHEQHQFPRLEQYVKKVSAPTTTGQYAYFPETNDVLKTKAEFDHAAEGTPKDIKTVVWNLKTYAAKYQVSKDLMSDSKDSVTPNWISEIQQTIQELQDNTNDKLIADQLTQNAQNKETATDAIADMKKAFNINLKPLDSANAQIIVSQSAYNALDQLKDGFGRPLLQPDPTSATSHQLFGKTLIVVDDELLGKAGDANVIIAPLNKVVADFQNDTVSGQFLDNFDVFENILGIYVRKDVETLRPDLITTIKLTDKSLAASNNTVAAGGSTPAASAKK